MPDFSCNLLGLQQLINDSKDLTSLVVTPSVTRGRAKMQKMVIPILTRSMNSETDGHGGGNYRRVVLRVISF